MITITLKPKKEESLLRFHPWVFSGAIARISDESSLQEGDLVRVESSRHEFLALGHWQIGSIAVRVISFTDTQIDRNFFKTKVVAAYRMRCDLGLINDTPERATNAYRLIHGEGDGLPGLVVDVYNNTAVLQAHSVGIHHIRQILAELIVEATPATKVYYKSEGTMPHKASVEVHDGYLIGAYETDDDLAFENGLRFRADWLHGQKTGFFLDQRENRALLERYSKGRDVLNMFCYTGGFSFYALRGDASMVHSVDASDKAIALVNENIQLNFNDTVNHESHVTDAFKFLESMKDGQYNLIILDPPAFAKHRDALHNAMVGYRRLNAMAFKKIRKGGILFTFSCSQAVNKEQFRLAVFTAAAQSGRHVRILHQLTQPIDHPINIYHPEGEYLKGLVLQIE